MTNRYALLINAIAQTNQTVLILAAAAVLTVLGWYALAWTPPFIRRPMQVLYILSAFVLYMATVLFTKG
jgi:hypothetical protein